MMVAGWVGVFAVLVGAVLYALSPASRPRRVTVGWVAFTGDVPVGVVRVHGSRDAAAREAGATVGGRVAAVEVDG